MRRVVLLAVIILSIALLTLKTIKGGVPLNQEVLFQDHKTVYYEAKYVSKLVPFNTLIGLLDQASVSASKALNMLGYFRSKSDTSTEGPYFDSTLIARNPEKLTIGVGLGHYYLIKMPCIRMFRDASNFDMIYYSFPIAHLANFKKSLLSHKDIAQKSQEVLYYENKNLYYVNESFSIPDYLQKHYDISINYTDSFATAVVYVFK